MAKSLGLLSPPEPGSQSPSPGPARERLPVWMGFEGKATWLPASRQKFSTWTFDYGMCLCSLLFHGPKYVSPQKASLVEEAPLETPAWVSGAAP